MQALSGVDVRLPFEVRWHGRGGQGAVTASRLLATGALAADYYPQSLPDFSAERAGAPVAAYTRIDRAPDSDELAQLPLRTETSGFLRKPDV